MLGKELKAKFEEFTQFTSDERPSDPGIKMHAGLYFHAKDVWESEVGDIRVQFSYTGRDGEQVITNSIIGNYLISQNNRTLHPLTLCNI